MNPRRRKTAEKKIINGPEFDVGQLDIEQILLGLNLKDFDNPWSRTRVTHRINIYSVDNLLYISTCDMCIGNGVLSPTTHPQCSAMAMADMNTFEWYMYGVQKILENYIALQLILLFRPCCLLCLTQDNLSIFGTPRSHYRSIQSAEPLTLGHNLHIVTVITIMKTSGR